MKCVVTKQTRTIRKPVGACVEAATLLWDSCSRAWGKVEGGEESLKDGQCSLHLLPLGFLSYTYYTAPQVQNSLFARVVVSAILPSNWESSLMGVHRVQVNNQ